MQIAFPLPNSPVRTTEEWSKIFGNLSQSGVIRSQLNELLVYANSTGMNTKVKSGAAFIKGVYYESDAEETLAISASDGTNPRIDRVIIRFDIVTETIQLAVLQGIPAVTPSPPFLTQNSSRWEIPLAQVLVSAGVVTIAADKITDERNHVGPTTPFIDLNKTEVTVSSANVLTQIPFATENITDNEIIRVEDNSIKTAENGLYYIDFQVDMSGVNSDQTAEILIRRYVDDTVYGDFGTMYRGATGQGGNNGGVPIRYSVILPITSISKVQFFARSSEAPRIVKTASIKMWKIN